MKDRLNHSEQGANNHGEDPAAGNQASAETLIPTARFQGTIVFTTDEDLRIQFESKEGLREATLAFWHYLDQRYIEDSLERIAADSGEVSAKDRRMAEAIHDSAKNAQLVLDSSQPHDEINSTHFRTYGSLRNELTFSARAAFPTLKEIPEIAEWIDQQQFKTAFK